MMAAEANSIGISLSQLLKGFAKVAPLDDRSISNLCLDSRTVEVGDCFVALAGDSDHGLRYIKEAIARGATAVLTDAVEVATSVDIPLVKVSDLRRRLGEISNRCYGSPSSEMTTVAVTGTNGKTTIASLIAAALSRLCGSAAYVGTLGMGIWGDLEKTANTTPDIISLQRFFRAACDTHVNACSMEASSHALAQGRLDGIQVDVGIFSNLSHDHLDYHGSLDAYGKAKKRLFEMALTHAVINIDDAFGRIIFQSLDNETQAWPYAVSQSEQSYPRLTTTSSLQTSLSGTTVEIISPFGHGLLRTPLIGEFNIANLLAALTALAALGWPYEDVIEALEQVPNIPGRMESVKFVDGQADDARERQPAIIIDYAHSPDSLQRALLTLRNLTRGRLVCIFGCGGDRDRTKRPMMGAIAEQFADHIIVTNDNPRSESGAEIAREVLSGCINGANVDIELDREQAIIGAIERAAVEDVILIAGKGHEQTQQIGTLFREFSDHDIALTGLRARHRDQQS